MRCHGHPALILHYYLIRVDLSFDKPLLSTLFIVSNIPTKLRTTPVRFFVFFNGYLIYFHVNNQLREFPKLYLKLICCEGVGMGSYAMKAKADVEFSQVPRILCEFVLG